MLVEYEQNGKPNALVSCWGAIGDLDWIDAENNIPTALYHGTLDPIVPFESGFPFTIDIALPIVYGSSLINDKLNELDIQNELYAEEGELHEYWGTVNGNWFSGPNNYFDQIKDTAFSFLYNQLDQNQIGDINSDDEVNVLDVILLVSMVLGLEDASNSSDINNDGTIDILDVIQLVNLIL